MKSYPLNLMFPNFINSRLEFIKTWPSNMYYKLYDWDLRCNSSSRSDDAAPCEPAYIRHFLKCGQECSMVVYGVKWVSRRSRGIKYPSSLLQICFKYTLSMLQVCFKFKNTLSLLEVCLKFA